MRIHGIRAFQDNYIWALQHGNTCVVVDPGDAAPVLAYLEKHKLHLSAILITHHHHDHTGGIAELLAHFPCPVYGPENSRTREISHPLADKQQITVPGIELPMVVYTCPGHTLDHIAFYSAPYLFCGDTLFAGGCGRMFEGTPELFYPSLQRLAGLPADTQVYCAHEYTQSNLAFAAAVEPSNLAISQRQAEVAQLRAEQQTTVPSEMASEHATNPFLRAHLPSVKAAAEAHCGHSLSNATAVFAILREWKNTF
jgi:hydroxyacylglutathione hydrolase